MERTINWLESTRRSLQASVPETSDSAPFLTDRLSELFLQRLPGQLASELVRLLPGESGAPFIRRVSNGHFAEYSIGYATFVEKVRHTLGLTDLLDSPPFSESEDSYAELCERVAQAFLWALAHELPVELKARIADHLPTDLSCRMNLFTGFSDTEKVA